MASLQRLDQIAKPDSFDDQKSASSVLDAETLSEDLSQFSEFFLSQIKRIIHGNQDGNWNDDPATVFGGDASLYALFQATQRNPLDSVIITDDGGLVYDNDGEILLSGDV